MFLVAKTSSWVSLCGSMHSEDFVCFLFMVLLVGRKIVCVLSDCSVKESDIIREDLNK